MTDLTKETSLASAAPVRRWPWQRTPVDEVERTMRELARQGTTMARVAHLFATLMVVLFSLGSLVALSGDSFSAIVLTVQQGGVPSLPQAISIAVSTLMVVCCDIGLVYAAMTLRVLQVRGSEAGWQQYFLHWSVLIGVSIIEAGTYLYMSAIYEHPHGWAWALVIARALAAPLLSVYLSMARAHPVTPRDILHQAELAQGIQLVRDVIRVAQDPTASLADKMRLYEASADMSAKDQTRLQGMITVVQKRLDGVGVVGSVTVSALPSPQVVGQDDQDDNQDKETAITNDDLDSLDSSFEEVEEVPVPLGRYNSRRVTQAIEATL